jgi:hypothetical protein
MAFLHGLGVSDNPSNSLVWPPSHSFSGGDSVSLGFNPFLGCLGPPYFRQGSRVHSLVYMYLQT